MHVVSLLILAHSLAQHSCSVQALVNDKGQIQAIWTTFWRLPLVFVALFAVRGICIAGLNYCFQAARKGDFMT